MAQQNSQVPGFPDPVGGRSKLQIIDHSGPIAGVYIAGGEVFPQQSVLGGPNSLGLSGVLYCSGGVTEDGLYQVTPISGGGGKVGGTIKLKWTVIATNTEAANGVNLSASFLRLLVIGG